MKRLWVSLCLCTSLCFAGGKPPIRIFAEGPSSQPLMTIGSYHYTVDPKGPGVSFQFKAEEGRKLAEISTHYVGKSLSFVVGENVRYSIRVRDSLKGNGLWLTVESSTALKQLETALRGN